VIATSNGITIKSDGDILNQITEGIKATELEREYDNRDEDDDREGDFSIEIVDEKNDVQVFFNCTVVTNGYDCPLTIKNVEMAVIYQGVDNVINIKEFIKKVENSIN